MTYMMDILLALVAIERGIRSIGQHWTNHDNSNVFGGQSMNIIMILAKPCQICLLCVLSMEIVSNST